MRFILDLVVLLTILPFLKGGKSYVIQPKSWDFRGHEIGYEVSRRGVVVSSPGWNETQMTFDDADKSNDPIVLLNGFGVGSFHQHRLIPKLHEGDHRIIYGVDYLGQGRSWPRNCDDGRSGNEKGLRYCAETWVDQIISFIEEVVLPEHATTGRQSRVHLVGNSVGGHLAAHIANRRPDLIAGICLLNPTPVWGLNLPGWTGHLPAPPIPKAIGRYLFDQIRDLNTIQKYLENAYARNDAFGEELMHQIRGCTLGTGGHAAFASILWSPPLNVSEDHKGNFEECLARLSCDVLLVFGKDDPWCKPAFAKKMLQALERREPNRVHRYVEVENCGHCPNHEAPQAVAKAVNEWVKADDRAIDQLQLVDADGEKFMELWGETILRERREKDIKLSWVDRLAVTFV
jgi:pimeloyl-ACP methyl ester carboxylesterase